MPNPYAGRNGKHFQKGNKANPRGAGAHNKDVKAIRRLTHEEIAEIGSLILDGNLKRLTEVRDDKNSTVLKVWICSVAIIAINKGDAQALNALLDRIVGKPKAEFNFTGVVANSGSPKNKEQYLAFIKEFGDVYGSRFVKTGV